MKKIFRKLRSFYHLLPNILKALVSRPETDTRPRSENPTPVAYRGRVMARAEQCVGCRLCVSDCPANALELIKTGKAKYQLIHYRDRCAYCAQCELSCRFAAIYLDHAYMNASGDRRDFRRILVDRNEEGLGGDQRN